MLYILNLLLLLFLLSDAGHSLLARETLRVSGLSTLADQYTSAIVSSNSAYNESQAAYSTSTSGHQSVSFTNVPTPLPYPLGSYDPGGLQNWQDLESGNCAVQDQFCSYEGFNEISGNASISAFADQCLLWDTSCVGNRTLAIEEFFNTTEGGILNNLCFSNFDSGNAGIALPEVPAASEPGQLVLEDAANSSDCKNYNPPERLSAWKKIKSWMRSPGCVSAQEEWVKMGGIAYENSSNASSCCEACVVAAQNVDLYYWPQPDVNTSCLSTIGNTVHPLGFGATTAGLDITTAGLDIYWACTAKTPVTSTYTWAGINAADVLATTTTVSMITTATLTIIGSIFVKAPLLDPWASSPCVEVDTTPRGSNGSNDSAEIQARYAPIQPRDHSLVIPSPITQEENMTVSTVVIGNFTFTSPTVYANFYNIQASDTCGQTTLSSTMLSFSAGELSTIEGPLRFDGVVQPTRRFDFRDLPCPPQSIMEANWYKPQPGEPYRPLIAMPSQLKQKIPWFSFCQDVFTAYDPPTALITATAFGPGPTPGRHAKAPPPNPAPSATLDPGARKTAGAVPEPPVTNDPAVRLPKATIGPVPLPKLGNPSSGSSDPIKENDGKQAGDPKHGSDSKQSSDTSGDPSQGDKPEEVNDPKISSGNRDDPGQGNKSGGGNEPEKGSDNSGDPSQGNDLKQGSGNSGDPSQGNDLKQSGGNSGDGTQGNDLKQSGGNSGDGTQGSHPTQNSGNNGDSSQGGDRNGGNDPTNDSDTGKNPSQSNASQQSSGTSENPGPEGDSYVPGLPLKPTVTVSGDHDISRPAGSIAPDEPRHSDTSNANGRESEQNPPESSANDVSTSPKIKSIVTTIAGQVITAAPTAITIPGIIIKQGGPGVTLRGTSVALDTAGQLVVDSKTIPIPPGTNTEPFTTTIGGQVIAATSDAFAIAGTTLVPGHAGVSVNGTLLSLDTAGHFVVGSKTRTFDSESMSLSAVTAGTPGPGGKSTPLVATPAGNVANQIAKGNGTVTGVQPFEGKAKDAFYCLKTKKGIVVFMAMILAVSM